MVCEQAYPLRGAQGMVDVEGESRTTPFPGDLCTEQEFTADALVDELRDADVWVIAAPIYNFGEPASLMAWIDQIARARLSFATPSRAPRGCWGARRSIF